MKTQGSHRILVVEDDKLIRLILTTVLSEEGFDVLSAECADDAVSLLIDPDDVGLIVTDVRMPGKLDGIEFAKLAREREAKMPIIFVSGYAAALSSRVREVGPPSTLINKPFDFDSILNAIGELVVSG
jgi:CheY-like chemotaxis protein